jgi:hypothetical protein
MDKATPAPIPSVPLPQYIIVPTTHSLLVNMILVVVFFLLYLAIIAYMALYDAKNAPNVRLFLDFLTDNQIPITDFNEKIKQVVQDTTNAKESFTTQPNTSIQSIVEFVSLKFNSFINQFISKTYIQGNTIKSTQKIHIV